MKNALKAIVAATLLLSLSVAFSVYATTSDDDAEYNEYLLGKIQDKNLGIRTSAMQLLGERKCEKAIKSLLWTLKNDKEYTARITAALALYKIGDTSILPELKRRAKNDRSKTVKHVLLGVIKEMETTYVAVK